ncbi:Os05g0510932, partial [Oryza sativa Japonica Group]
SPAPASTSGLPAAAACGTGLMPLNLIQKQPRQRTRRSMLWTMKRATQALVRNWSGGAR